MLNGFYCPTKKFQYLSASIGGKKVEKKIGNKNQLPILVAFQFLKNIGIAPIY